MLRGFFFTTVTALGAENVGDAAKGLGARVGYNSNDNFALDAGLVAEVYSSPRTIIRFDVGDTIVRFQSAGRDLFSGTEAGSTDISHNLQAGISFSHGF